MIKQLLFKHEHEHKRKFKLHIKQFCLIGWSLEKILKVKTQRLEKRKNGRIILSLNCAVCDVKKSKFIKEQEASGLFSSSEITTPLIQIPLLRAILF